MNNDFYKFTRMYLDLLEVLTNNDWGVALNSRQGFAIEEYPNDASDREVHYSGISSTGEVVEKLQSLLLEQLEAALK